MNALLEQFLSESRESLESIGQKLMALENAPNDAELMVELFRLVHTLKGNSGLFDFPEMTRVLHAGEDLMDAVRNQRTTYSPTLADRLLDAMDFVGMICDDIENGRPPQPSLSTNAEQLAQLLRQLINTTPDEFTNSDIDKIDLSNAEQSSLTHTGPSTHFLLGLEESVRMDTFLHLRSAPGGQRLWWIQYHPSEECFFQGEDPLHQAKQTPGYLWGSMAARAPWPELSELDAYSCQLGFEVLALATRESIEVHYRYIPDQISCVEVPSLALALPKGNPNGGPVYEDFILEALTLLNANELSGLSKAVNSMLELSSSALWLSSALRWIRQLLTEAEVDLWAVHTLIESLHTLEEPNWASLIVERANLLHLQESKGKLALPAASRNPGPVTISEVNITPNLQVVNSNAVQVEVKVDSTENELEIEALNNLLEVQREVLSLPDDAKWLKGRIKAAAACLAGCLRASGRSDEIKALEMVVKDALAQGSSVLLASWLDQAFPEGTDLQMQPTDLRLRQTSDSDQQRLDSTRDDRDVSPKAAQEAFGFVDNQASSALLEAETRDSMIRDTDIRLGRRSDDVSSKSLKVDQVKIDRLMNLIGEMVVAKNAIPYLANRAETQFGVRELSREIKAQYAVINRISEEMQDAIMQVRMMPVSFVFQRFPRLVRDTSRRLGKDVDLVLEGQDTAADKNIIESLGDPLVHIVRNSLDHGLEMPEVRRAAGKPVVGTLKISARQESDRVLIEISDDGNGIDPEIVKRKAYEKGLIDEHALDRMSDQEAVNLIFQAGFSTAEVISDLSGRGVGMDVVRTAVERVNGSIQLHSTKGQGTHIRLSLPLSMAVTNVMTIESNGQMFGVPIDAVVETVRVARSSIHHIKQDMVTVLRERVVPIKSLNAMLGLSAPALTNDNDEFALLLVRQNEDVIGLLIDDFHQTTDIILKPLSGVLGMLKAYAGSALMGDGSVLMILNIKEML